MKAVLPLSVMVAAVVVAGCGSGPATTAGPSPAAPTGTATPFVAAAPPSPAAGPVVPLTMPALSPGGILATRSQSPAIANDNQRLVERVLVQGAPPEPRPGRADDFGWPRL